MKKKIWTAGILSVSLLFTSLSPGTVSRAEQEPTALPLITRVESGTAGSLVHYKYVDENGQTVNLEQSNSGSSRKRSASLPASYDARTDGIVTSIKDQAQGGTCWAFGPIKSLESNMIKNGMSSLTDTDLSECHLAWYAYTPETDTGSTLYGDAFQVNPFDNIFDQGGNPLIATTTLANWWGAAREADAPYSANSNSEISNMTKRMEAADNSLRTKDAIHLSDATCYDTAGRDAIKQAILNNGCMSVSLYFNESDVYQQGDTYSVYQSRATEDDANHVVTIVGWDDNFSTFKNKPAGNGAWLIANSYGTSFGNQGYYWVSYYDTSLCEFYSFEADSADNYDTNYQYDGIGYNTSIYDEEEDILFSNIFTNTSSSCQGIRAASFYTVTDNQKYKIEVYRNLKGNNPTDGELIDECTTIGTADYSGYHTVPLATSAPLQSGEKFSIVVTFYNEGKTIYVPIEGMNNPRYDVTFQSNTGESFVYDSDTRSWLDTTKYPDSSFFSSRTINLNNLCLKAFGDDISQEEYQDLNDEITTTATPEPTDTSEPTEEPLNTTVPTEEPSQTKPATPETSENPSPQVTEKPQESTVPATGLKSSYSSLTIGKGEKVTLQITATPVNTTDTFSYNSDNVSVASVSSKGVVTGNKKGTANITVNASSGASITIPVTVKQAPSSLKVKAGKTKIKKGKSTKIKVTLSSGSASHKLTYRSSNKKIAQVSSSGVVTGKKKGTVKITVKTFNGKKGSVKITIK